MGYITGVGITDKEVERSPAFDIKLIEGIADILRRLKTRPIVYQGNQQDNQPVERESLISMDGCAFRFLIINGNKYFAQRYKLRGEQDATMLYDLGVFDESDETIVELSPEMMRKFCETRDETAKMNHEAPPKHPRKVQGRFGVNEGITTLELNPNKRTSFINSFNSDKYFKILESDGECDGEIDGQKISSSNTTNLSNKEENEKENKEENKDAQYNEYIVFNLVSVANQNQSTNNFYHGGKDYPLRETESHFPDISNTKKTQEKGS
ncbi:MAG: hypothetical protein LBH47_01500 [Christensenellaceae bacterium]|jgi:hypothetical protein|nr:hypothetical protein [Christensenellaceae bacterium]